MSAQIKTPTQPSQTARTIETRNNEVNLKKPISKVNSESAFPAILCTRSPVRSRVIIRKRLLRILEALVTGKAQLELARTHLCLLLLRLMEDVATISVSVSAPLLAYPDARRETWPPT